ncbi:MAG: divalent-cation tolerance protein CutA [bacterium]|nr:divalent-cation tolerance protein CutA [bacterium]
MSAIVILTTVGDEAQGQLIARELVGRRQAACVNMVAGVRSFYRWQGEVCDDAEHLLVIKTTASQFDAVTQTIQELHSYDLPEIIAIDVSRGEPGFLEWIAASVGDDAG